MLQVARLAKRANVSMANVKPYKLFLSQQDSQSEVEICCSGHLIQSYMFQSPEFQALPPTNAMSIQGVGRARPADSLIS